MTSLPKWSKCCRRSVSANLLKEVWTSVSRFFREIKDCSQTGKQWDMLRLCRPTSADTNVGCSLSVRLRAMVCLLHGTVKKVLRAVESLASHSIQTEWLMSEHTYNIIVDDNCTCMSTETINARLIIALNWSWHGSLNDPMPAVVQFLEMKQRISGEPDPQSTNSVILFRSFSDIQI